MMQTCWAWHSEATRDSDILGVQALGLDKNMYQQLSANSADSLALAHALHVDIHRVKQNDFLTTGLRRFA